MATNKPAHRPADAYTYRALRPIYHGNALAYATGDLVPEENVKRHGYTDDQVERAEGETPAPSTKRTKPAGGDAAS